MKERPILMSGPMVRAILDGRKTVTRRVMRTNHVGYRAFYRWDGEPFRRAMMRCSNETAPGTSVFCENNRFGVPGDRLWVRETWADVEPLPSRTPAYDGARFAVRPDGSSSELWYRADGEMGVTSLLFDDGPRWRPSIHMPRWASRITLEVLDVRVERLHEIDEEDAAREGVERSVDGYWVEPGPDGPTLSTAREAFSHLWDIINGPGSWASNPWVWRLEFRRLSEGGAA